MYMSGVCLCTAILQSINQTCILNAKEMQCNKKPGIENIIQVSLYHSQYVNIYACSPICFYNGSCLFLLHAHPASLQLRCCSGQASCYMT